MKRTDLDGGQRGSTGDLESRARRVAGHVEVDETGPTPRSIVSQEVAFVLERLDAIRGLHDQQHRSLLRAECYTDTELMQMEQRTPRYAPDRFPEREKLHHRLFTIEAERRRLDSAHEDKVQELQSRLWTLLQRHAQLDLG